MPRTPGDRSFVGFDFTELEIFHLNRLFQLHPEHTLESVIYISNVTSTNQINTMGSEEWRYF